MIFFLGALAVGVVGLVGLFVLIYFGTSPLAFILIIPFILSLWFYIKLYVMSKEIKSLKEKMDVLIRDQKKWWLQ
jgi:hypothetical protein